MAKKFKKSTKSVLNILLVILAFSLFLFGVVIFKTNNGNPDVKGDSTASSMPMIKRDGVAGEACGKSINRACQKNLICAPLGPSYRLLATKASAVESTTESETATSEETVSIGKTEDEIKDGRPPYIPYYGACVKKGVWPISPQKLTPTPTEAKNNPISFPNCRIRYEPIIECPVGYMCENTCNPSSGKNGCAQYDKCVLTGPTSTKKLLVTPTPTKKIVKPIFRFTWPKKNAK